MTCDVFCCAVWYCFDFFFFLHTLVVVVSVVGIFPICFQMHMHLTRRCARGGHVGASQYFAFSDLPEPLEPTAEMIYSFLPRIAMDIP